MNRPLCVLICENINRRLDYDHYWAQQLEDYHQSSARIIFFEHTITAYISDSRFYPAPRIIYPDCIFTIKSSIHATGNAALILILSSLFEHLNGHMNATVMNYLGPLASSILTPPCLRPVSIMKSLFLMFSDYTFYEKK